LVHRVILIILLLLGLAIGIHGGIEQAGLGRSIYLVSEISKSPDCKSSLPQLQETQDYLDACFKLTSRSMYLGIAVVLTAGVGLYFQGKRQ